MHLSRIYSNSFRPTLIPLLITNFNALSEEATQYTIEIIGNSIFDDRNDIDLINFVISCISHPYEPTAISAARIFQNDQMIPLQEACILQLAQMTGRNFDLTQYNLSTQCLETLTDLLSIHPDEVMRVLYPRIQTALQSQDEQQTKCSLRCLSIIHTKIDKISELVDFVLPFLNSPLVCDAAYCLASIAETNPQFKKSVIDVLFMCIQNVQFPQKVRSQIQSFIPPLLCNILLPPDPYIKILLTLLMNTQEPYDQGLLLYLLSKFLENVTTLEDYDSVNALVQVAYLALKNFDVFGSAALHLFGNIIVKNRNVFQQVLIEVSEKAFQSLSDVENVNLVCYSIHFFMQAAVASVLYNLPIVEIIGKVSPCIVQLLRTESRLYAWDFLICLHDTYKDCFYALMDVFMRVIVETPNDERLEVIGRIAIITSYCIDDKGKEVINAFGNDIMRVLQEGFKFCVEDSNIERKRIGFCIAKVYLVAQAPVPQKIFEDLLLIFSDYMSEEEKKNFSPILHALYKQ
ncbi:hypothetical protein GPJ56_003294 [Histomonas meleagridis]|uniref:uncharacterized protein n=1 Tax=Histomonas meleagridis TaxID=135588 RepID=UPI00355A57A3|nr:hypothetical protein GPJ56_003294 [Histomonas meleagridis]KAH0805955.1 hypothetical protein GO595_001286 [Histomonas meleagridis]